jgi:ribosomal protein L40E
MLLEAVSAFIIVGYAATQSGSSFGTIDGVWIALAALLLIISIMVMIAAMRFRRGTYPGLIAKIVILLAVISLIVEGGGMYAVSTDTAGGWATSAALAIAAGVVLLLAMFFVSAPSMGMKLTGAIFSIVFAALMIAKLASMPGAQTGGTSLNSAFVGVASIPSGAPGYYYSFLSAAATQAGTLGVTYLAFIAFLLVGVALLFRAFVLNSRIAPLALIVALVGFIIYGIDMAWGNLDALSRIGDIQNWAIGAVPVISAVLLTLASFIVMAACVVGMIHYAGSMGAGAGMGTGVAAGMGQQPMAQQPMQAPTSTFCPNCGTENPASNNFCRKCGAKLG